MQQSNELKFSSYNQQTQTKQSILRHDNLCNNALDDCKIIKHAPVKPDNII